MDIKSILLAIVLILLGCSFAYKAFLGMFMGRVYYWSGLTPTSLGLFGLVLNPIFLILTAASTFLIHLPPGKNSMVKTAQSWWVHLLAPVFLLVSLALISAGADQIGLPGSAGLNMLLRLGAKPGADPAITYSRTDGYKFPVVKEVGDALVKAFSAQADLKEKDKLIQGQQ